MKKLIMIVAFLLIPFTAMAGMTPLTSSEMGNTTGQLGLGIDVDAIESIDITTTLNVSSVSLLGGFITVGTVGDITADLDIATGAIDLDVEITPAGIVVDLDIASLDIDVASLSAINLDVNTLGGTGLVLFDAADLATQAYTDLLNLSLDVDTVNIDVSAVHARIDVLPSTYLLPGTTLATTGGVIP